MNTNDAIKVLKENGLKYTDKRKDMLDIFVKEDKYLNAKHIQQQMDKDYPGISFDTVYRNLHLFKDLGIIEYRIRWRNEIQNRMHKSSPSSFYLRKLRRN